MLLALQLEQPMDRVGESVLPPGCIELIAFRDSNGRLARVMASMPTPASPENRGISGQLQWLPVLVSYTPMAPTLVREPLRCRSLGDLRARALIELDAEETK